ncbi:hypothetical protein SAMN05444397_109206 [Flavobacterium aquidurense]|uniref:Uncharacterized protein n=1 Tax=Flavobacterium frigidimaris TaxID=262320 RepID=A0ABX4BUY6_FLAFR|nr:hypothetical protein [Flavobacterium frigidimaris]OXA81084.1 hypothetical protein B0A65_04895 [Flavobacterium frigidimaris]SDZ58685.1 hypothetical protein SAMN05444397_109206 [Flavobacterium aquidurense]
MFKNLFSRQNKITKSVFLAGWEVRLNGDQQCENFIATQITNKSTVETLYSGIELVFENDKLIKAYDYEDGDRKDRELRVEEIGLEYKKFEENRILQLVEDNRGLHQLGGEIPNEFQIPENNCVVPFQYLGYINNQDRNFNWLPFKVHLICPIYLNIENVFLDYSNLNKPTIINREEVENTNTSYNEDLNQTSEIVFNEMRFSFVEKKEFSGTADAGIPNWIQYPDIPICPKSGNRMKFLCQLNGGVSAKRTNVEPKDEWYRHYYEKLNFWGDGDLFVFFEPTSKVACYFIQNT